MRIEIKRGEGFEEFKIPFKSTNLPKGTISD